ncbi:MAG TPA: TlpA disulfide reductase family protein [Chitinophagaceae bacterium]|jgi:thiol-disulfide isomerase/thioredoxin|nr:TlpA disulfide reductase family protein [Chitinophagaceae bacterium]
MPNYSMILDANDSFREIDFKKISVIKEDGSQLKLEELKGNVILLDLWNSTCINCIEGFPKLEELKETYKGINDIRIAAVNIPIPIDSLKNISKLTKKFTFNKWKLNSSREAEDMGITSVPITIILDKNLRCVYAGSFNFGWNIFYGNAKRIINRLR